jgi:splicing factor U2AF subunit
MAERLAKIFGTEEDKVNCPFYFKIGACRHGETCTRIHNKPPVSQTMVLPHLYDNPPAAVAFADGLDVPQENLVEAVNHFEDFYEEVFMELAKYGELDEIVVADNIGEHMIGNVYVKFQSEEQALAAMNGLNGRYYAGKVIVAEYSPVTDFREAKCRQYNEGACDRGGYCNFMHPKHVSRDLKSQLFKQMYDEHPDYREDRRNRRNDAPTVPPVQEKEKSPPRERVKERERDPRKDRRRSRSREHGRGNDRYRERRSSRSGERRRQHSSRSRERDGYRSSKRYEKDDSRDHHHKGGDSRSRRDDDAGLRTRTLSDRQGPANNGVNRETEDARLARQTSEERRAMIAAWNQEDDAPAHKSTSQENKV